MQAMVLTAGKGNRLRPYTEVLPKPAIPLLNAPMLCYGLELLRPLGLKTIVGNLHHLPEQMATCWNSLPVPAEKLHLSDERAEILGGGGGLKKAQEYFDRESLFFVNGDEVLLPEDPLVLKKLWDHHHANNNIATLLCIDHEGVGTQFGGVWVKEQGEILGFGKTPPPGVGPQATRGLHYVGYLVVSYDIFDFLPEGIESNLLYDGITQAIQKGHKAQAFMTKARWYETGNPDDYLLATEALIKSRTSNSDTYLSTLLDHWTEPYQLLQEGKLFAAKSAKLPKTLKVNDFAVVGPGVELAENISLSRSVIGPGVCLEYPQSIENQLVLA